MLIQIWREAPGGERRASEFGKVSSLGAFRAEPCPARASRVARVRVKLSETRVARETRLEHDSLVCL
jgi:hypothetical protein